MSRARVHAANGAALALALAAAAALAGLGDRAAPIALPRAPEAVPQLQTRSLPEGGRALVDAGGRLVPLRDHRRIVSTTLLADGLLLELAEPDRVLAYGAGTAAAPARWRFAGKPAVDGLGPVEAIIALKPDLVLTTGFGDPGRLDKLRQAGIAVFDLGEQRGVVTLRFAAEAIGALLGDPARGSAFARDFAARMARVAAPLGQRPRRRALYLTVIAGNLYGGTRGTSYHDVLTHAALDDVAATRHRDWPQYRPEEIVRLDPDLLITQDETRAAICSVAPLAASRPCRTGAVLSLPRALLDDPGIGMLTASERLFDLAYPSLTRP